MPERSRLSVVMPAHNVAPYVEAAVASVAAQSWPEIELLAVDDGSTDATGVLLDRLAVEWDRADRQMVVRHQAQQGAAAARNAGLRAASGGFVAFFDADDRLTPGLLTTLMGALRADPAAEMVFPRWHYIDARGHAYGPVSPPATGPYAAADLMAANPVHTASGVLLRRQAAARTGWFDTSLTACIDLDYWVRLAGERRDAIRGVPDAWADYRKRPGQITDDWRRMERNWIRVCDKLAVAGHGLAGATWRGARARNCLYWSSLAYEAGDYRAARRLIAECWRRDARFARQEPLARIRSLAALASLLPGPLHRAVRRGFNARQG